MGGSHGRLIRVALFEMQRTGISHGQEVPVFNNTADNKAVELESGRCRVYIELLLSSWWVTTAVDLLRCIFHCSCQLSVSVPVTPHSSW